jgi:hypothetical protein
VFYIGLAVYCLASGAYSATVADAKGYSTGAWFFGGLFFGVLALIAIAGMPVRPKLNAPPHVGTSKAWLCPECGTTNGPAYVACAKCGHKRSAP